MANRKPISAGNWKLHKNPSEAGEFIREIAPLAQNFRDTEIIVAPTILALSEAVSAAKGTSISISAQNCYSKDEGAYTGETSPAHLKSVGVTHVILGHSERRHIFKETDREINAKLKASLAHGLIPILCIGEQLEEREAGKVEEVLNQQLTYGLEGIDADEKLIVAYEPVWAIGTGKVASKEDAQQAHEFTRSVLSKLISAEVAAKVRILYGGSVKPENIESLIAMPDIDGALVGGASLKAESFSKITEVINRA